MGGFLFRKKAPGGQEESGAPGGIVGARGGARETVRVGVPAPLRRLPLPAAVPGQKASRETVRLTLAVPRELHRRLKLAAVRQERSIVSLVSGWIEERTAAA